MVPGAVTHMSDSLKLVFAGTPEFAASCLEALLNSNHELLAVYTQPDRPAGRGRKLKASPVKNLALEHGLPVYQPQSLKNEEAQAQLAALNADLMVVVAYGLILPPAVLAIPAKGCVNVHASLLPRWRGAAPIQRAILAADQQTGITIMQMDQGLDTGDMLSKCSTDITQEDTAQTLHDRLAGIGADLLVQTLDQIAAGRVLPEAQDETQANYATKLSKDEAKINWENTASEIHRQIRGFNPWPVAFTEFNGEPLRIWEAQLLDAKTGAVAGTVVDESKQGFDVACGEGTLRLKVLQFPGKRPMEAAALINARSLKGCVLGQPS